MAIHDPLYLTKVGLLWAIFRRFEAECFFIQRSRVHHSSGPTPVFTSASVIHGSPTVPPPRTVPSPLQTCFISPCVCTYRDRSALKLVYTAFFTVSFFSNCVHNPPKHSSQDPTHTHTHTHTSATGCLPGISVQGSMGKEHPWL